MTLKADDSLNFRVIVKSKGTLWTIYFFIYLIYLIAYSAYFFSSDSYFNIFYKYLMAFDPYYLFRYLLNAFSITLNALTLIPLSYYICRIYYLPAKFWQWFFIIRMTVDLTSRLYEIRFIEAMTFHDMNAALNILGTIVIISAPSYLALYNYAMECEN